MWLSRIGPRRYAAQDGPNHRHSGLRQPDFAVQTGPDPAHGHRPRIAFAHAVQDCRRPQSGRHRAHRYGPQLRRLHHHLGGRPFHHDGGGGHAATDAHRSRHGRRHLYARRGRVPRTLRNLHRPQSLLRRKRHRHGAPEQERRQKRGQRHPGEVLMTPAQFQARVKKGTVPPATLLLGPEAYERRRIKDALLRTVPADAVSQNDLAELTLAEILDDARALSLFASERLIWIVNAELALPRARAAASDDEEGDSTSAAGGGDAAPLAAYLKDPTPGVTLVFEAIRHDFEGEDKRKQDRVRKFYATIPDVVELQKYSPQDARGEAESLIRQAGFRMEPAALDLLIEALGAEIARVGHQRRDVLHADHAIAGEQREFLDLHGDARATTIFALVNALGRRDRARALGILDTLTREGEYLPLALAFLSTQFRMALVAREAGLKSSQQIQGHFSRLGVAMWGSRAEQVYQTVSKFNRPQLERALGLIYKAVSYTHLTLPT